MCILVTEYENYSEVLQDSGMMYETTPYMDQGGTYPAPAPTHKPPTAAVYWEKAKVRKTMAAFAGAYAKSGRGTKVLPRQQSMNEISASPAGSKSGFLSRQSSLQDSEHSGTMIRPPDPVSMSPQFNGKPPLPPASPHKHAMVSVQSSRHAPSTPNTIPYSTPTSAAAMHTSQVPMHPHLMHMSPNAVPVQARSMHMTANAFHGGAPSYAPVPVQLSQQPPGPATPIPLQSSGYASSHSSKPAPTPSTPQHPGNEGFIDATQGMSGYHGYYTKCLHGNRTLKKIIKIFLFLFFIYRLKSLFYVTFLILHLSYFSEERISSHSMDLSSLVTTTAYNDSMSLL